MEGMFIRFFLQPSRLPPLQSKFWQARWSSSPWSFGASRVTSRAQVWESSPCRANARSWTRWCLECCTNNCGVDSEQKDCMRLLCSTSWDVESCKMFRKQHLLLTKMLPPCSCFFVTRRVQNDAAQCLHSERSRCYHPLLKCCSPKRRLENTVNTVPFSSGFYTGFGHWIFAWAGVPCFLETCSR